MKMAICLLIVTLFLALDCIIAETKRNNELRKELLKTEISLLKEKLNCKCKAPEM